MAPHVATRSDQTNVGFPRSPKTSSNCSATIIFSISPCVVLPSQFLLGLRGTRRLSCHLTLLAFSILASSSHNPHSRTVLLTSQQPHRSNAEQYFRYAQCESPSTLATMLALR